MKKVKLFFTIFFITFAVGGFYSANAYTTSRSLTGLKADFLGEPHYIPNIIGRDGETPQEGVTKLDWGTQQWKMTIADDRTILVALTNQDGASMSGYSWYSVVGTTNGFVNIPNSDGLASAPTSITGNTFATAAKLGLPWVQAKVSSGTWIIDN